MKIMKIIKNDSKKKYKNKSTLKNNRDFDLGFDLHVGFWTTNKAGIHSVITNYVSEDPMSGVANIISIEFLQRSQIECLTPNIDWEIFLDVIKKSFCEASHGYSHRHSHTPTHSHSNSHSRVFYYLVIGGASPPM